LKYEAVVLRLGQKKTVALITTISIFLSVVVTFLITYYFDSSNLWTSPNLSSSDWVLIISSAVLVPLIVAPIVSWHIVHLVFRIHELRNELHRLATTDTLTGLNNRGAMLASVEHLHHLAIRDKQALLLLMLDIDHFKLINDQHGHAAGDLVLQELGVILKQVVRGSDLVGRIGGEEFLLCVYKGTTTEANHLVQRLQKAIREKEFSFKGRRLKVTLSIGIAKMSADEPLLLGELLQRSDMALYQAKNAGRDQSIEFTPEPLAIAS
jgi:diguanylate cyclase (GGDEF)-like protein